MVLVLERVPVEFLCDDSRTHSSKARAVMPASR